MRAPADCRTAPSLSGWQIPGWTRRWPFLRSCLSFTPSRCTSGTHEIRGDRIPRPSFAPHWHHGFSQVAGTNFDQSVLLGGGFHGLLLGSFYFERRTAWAALIASWILLPLYPFGVFMDIWGRLSLGRNIGMLPAQRKIVDRGAYRWVRHPIYTAAFLILIAGALASYSLCKTYYCTRWGSSGSWRGALPKRSSCERIRHIRPTCERVRWRWFPGLI